MKSLVRCHAWRQRWLVGIHRRFDYDRPWWRQRLLHTPSSILGNTRASGGPGIATRHERGRLLVAHLDESNTVAAFTKSLFHSVDAVAGKTEYGIDPPLDEPVYEQV